MISKDVLINYIEKCYPTKEIAKELNCDTAWVKLSARMHGIKIPRLTKIKNKICKTCGKSFGRFNTHEGKKIAHWDRDNCFECVPYISQHQRDKLSHDKKLICNNCDKEFERFVEIGGKKIKLSRPYCLECSPYKSKQYIQLSKGYCKPEYGKSFVCHGCKNQMILDENNFYRWKKGPSKEKFQKRCKICVNKERDNNRAKVKQWCVDYKGGKCCKCGYDKCLGALDFHHLDPSEKKFNIGELSNKAFTKNFEQIKAELDKCELVCSNCHRELHYKIRSS